MRQVSAPRAIFTVPDIYEWKVSTEHQVLSIKSLGICVILISNTAPQPRNTYLGSNEILPRFLARSCCILTTTLRRKLAESPITRSADPTLLILLSSPLDRPHPTPLHLRNLQKTHSWQMHTLRDLLRVIHSLKNSAVS